MNANDTLRHHNCSDDFFRYNFGVLITEGAKALADNFHCYWFLDVVASYQPKLQKEEFQVWNLKKLEDDSAIVTCTDGNNRVLAKQHVDYTDLKATTATVWVEGNVILLPSEH